MRLSIQTPPQHASFAELRDYWCAADELGLYAAYTCDHLVPLRPLEGPHWPGEGSRHGGHLDGWVAATGLAAATSSLRLGVLVSDVTLRPPALLAKMAVTLDHVTGGRAVLGVGAGWHAEEHDMFGIPLPSAAERAARLTEALRIMRSLFSAPRAVSFDGTYYRLADAYFQPASLTAPALPILVGGSGPRVRATACRYADALNSFGSPAEWMTRNAELDRQLCVLGRAPRELARSAYVFADLSGDSEREAALLTALGRRQGGRVVNPRTAAVLADPEIAVPLLQAYADAGVEEVVLGLRAPYRASALERFAIAVLPHIA